MTPWKGHIIIRINDSEKINILMFFKKRKSMKSKGKEGLERKREEGIREASHFL